MSQNPNQLCVPSVAQISKLIKGNNKSQGLAGWEMLCARLKISEPDIQPASLIGMAATVAVESAYTFCPISELGTPEYFRQMYGNRPDYIVDTKGRWVWRGRGILQLSGRSNYAAASTALGLPFLEKPDMALWVGPSAAVACWFWKVHGLSHLCEAAGTARDDMHWQAVRRAVNGGLNGWAEFREIVKMLGGID